MALKTHKATPATWGGLFARFVVRDVRSVVAFTAIPSDPSIQNGTGHWDGVDWLNPSKTIRRADRQEPESDPAPCSQR